MTESSREPIVFVVDDDASIRTAMRRGLVAAGFTVRTFASADTFLAAHDPDAPGCLVADVAMPGMSGLELQSVLAARGAARPIIFVTARGASR
jgi:FixJ family two-component response regulator